MKISTDPSRLKSTARSIIASAPDGNPLKLSNSDLSGPLHNFKLAIATVMGIKPLYMRSAFEQANYKMLKTVDGQKAYNDMRRKEKRRIRRKRRKRRRRKTRKVKKSGKQKSKR